MDGKLTMQGQWKRLICIAIFILVVMQTNGGYED